jgi:hypothetical protein
MTFNNDDIYQWNARVQHELKGKMLLEVVYTASRSHDLPLVSAANQDFVSGGQPGEVRFPRPVSTGTEPVLLFQGPNAIFNVPASTYNNLTIAQINLLRPYPQFDGSFSDSPASGNY